MCELDLCNECWNFVGMSTSSIVKNIKFKFNEKIVGFGTSCSLRSVFRSNLHLSQCQSKSTQPKIMKFLWEKLDLSIFLVPLESPLYLIWFVIYGCFKLKFLHSLESETVSVVSCF